MRWPGVARVPYRLVLATVLCWAAWKTGGETSTKRGGPAIAIRDNAHLARVNTHLRVSTPEGFGTTFCGRRE